MFVTHWNTRLWKGLGENVVIFTFYIEAVHMTFKVRFHSFKKERRRRRLVCTKLRLSYIDCFGLVFLTHPAERPLVAHFSARSRNTRSRMRLESLAQRRRSVRVGTFKTFQIRRKRMDSLTYSRSTILPRARVHGMLF